MEATVSLAEPGEGSVLHGLVAALAPAGAPTGARRTAPAARAAGAARATTAHTVFARPRQVDRQRAVGVLGAVELLMAFWASASLPISTNAKPFERPVSRSVMRVTDLTAPALAKRVCRSRITCRVREVSDVQPVFHGQGPGLSFRGGQPPGYAPGVG